MKKAPLKRQHTIWFHLYDILEKEILYREQISGYQGLGVRSGAGRGGNFGGWCKPTPVLLPGKSHRWRSLEGCSPWGREESDTTERLHFHFSLSCIGERNGNPLQCSCLENPRDRGAWWAAVYGVAQSRTRLKQLGSSSSSNCSLSCVLVVIQWCIVKTQMYMAKSE